MLRPADEISIVMSVTGTGAPVFRGTAFPAIACGMWITAGNCVKLEGQETLGLYSAISRRLEGIAAVHIHPELDLAVLRGVSNDTTLWVPKTSSELIGPRFTRLAAWDDLELWVCASST